MLLAEAGYEPGSLEGALLFPGNSPTAEQIVGQFAPALEEIGIMPVLHGVPYSDMIQVGRTMLAAGENVLLVAPAEIRRFTSQRSDEMPLQPNLSSILTEHRGHEKIHFDVTELD